jgi:hypothetical protein
MQPQPFSIYCEKSPLGAFPLAERLHLGFGDDVQIAVTQFHQYNHRWIVSVRFPF